MMIHPNSKSTKKPKGGLKPRVQAKLRDSNMSKPKTQPKPKK